MNRIQFRVTELSASVPESVPLEWQGKPLSSGQLTIELDETATSRGELDYSTGRAAAEFHVRLKFPELAEILEDLGVDPSLTAPVRAVVRSEGEIRDDHRLALNGRCELRPHELFPPEESAASVLPGH
ncbi:MAG: hypothetical protein ACYTF8_00130 [Planctomycetota bacterium]|jgi:hypothetical protein